MRTLVPTLALLIFVSAVSAQDRGRALDLLEESAALYDAERYAEAVVLLRRAYELHPEPTLLYNLGRALEGTGDREAAIAAYRRYLEAADAPRAAEAEQRVRALEAELAASRREQVEEEPSLPAPREEPGVAPWVILGAGTGTALAGAALGGVALARDAASEDPMRSQESADRLDDEARRFAIGADVLLSVGIVAAVTGLLWALLRKTPEDGARVELSPTAVRYRF